MRQGNSFTAGLIAFVLAAAVALPSVAAAQRLNCGMNNGKKATGTPIPLGAVVGKTGPADYSTSARTAEAYFKCVNDNGGIHGRPISYTIVDDGWSPEQAAQVASKLVRDLKVLALVGNSSFVECAANEALYEAEGVLVVAGVGVPRDCFHAKNIAPTNNGPRLSNDGAAQYLVKNLGVKKIVCISGNIPNVGKWNCDGMASTGASVQNILIDFGSLDPTSVLLQAASFHPDMIEVSLPKEAALPIFAAAEQQNLGPKYKWGAPTSLYDPSIPKALGPYWDSKLYVEMELEPIDKKSPDMLNWHAVLDKYGESSIPRDTFSEAGYIAARAATEALLKMDPAKIDRQSVSEAIRNIKGFKSDIMCGPWYFGPGDEHNANHSGSVAVVKGNGYKVVEGCTDIADTDLTGIRKLETKYHLTH